MRKLLISLLLASAVATPAIAGPRNWSDRQQAQSDRQQAREDRQQVREERQQVREDRSAERPSFVAQPRQQAVQPQQLVERQQFAQRQQFARPDRSQRQADMNAMRVQRQADAAQRRQDIRDARDLRQANRPQPNVIRDRHPLVVSETPRPGTQPPLRGESRVQWNTNWRHGGHYDWRRYRDHHRSLFHLGFYYDPFGWGYQPFSIGYRMWPAYYGNQYWIDPMMYGLPYAPPGAAWVRYWNDAVLVDVYTGTVIDVIPGFFW